MSSSKEPETSGSGTAEPVANGAEAPVFAGRLISKTIVASVVNTSPICEDSYYVVSYEQCRTFFEAIQSSRMTSSSFDFEMFMNVLATVSAINVSDEEEAYYTSTDGGVYQLEDLKVSKEFVPFLVARKVAAFPSRGLASISLKVIYETGINSKVLSPSQFKIAQQEILEKFKKNAEFVKDGMSDTFEVFNASMVVMNESGTACSSAAPMSYPVPIVGGICLGKYTPYSINIALEEFTFNLKKIFRS